MRRRVELVAAIAASLLTLLYPASVFIALPSHPGDAWRWVRDSPTFAIFLPLVLPVALYLFLSSLDRSGLARSWRRRPKLVAALTVGLVVSALAFVAADAARAPIEPFLRSPSAPSDEHPVATERALRDEMRRIAKTGSDEGVGSVSGKRSSGS